MTQEPDKQLVKDWIAALRSGNYVQTYGFMHTSEGFCPFGVLCSLVDPDGWVVDYIRDGNTIYAFQSEEGTLSTWILPDSIYDRIGFNDNYEDQLIDLSDRNRVPFDQIADYIENLYFGNTKD